jgi:hypothetical protein
VASALAHKRGQIAMLEHADELAEEALGAAHRAHPTDEGYALDYARFLGSRDRLSAAQNVIDRTLALPISTPAKAAEHYRKELKELKSKIEWSMELDRRARLARSATPLGPLGTSSITSSDGSWGARTTTQDATGGSTAPAS